MHLNIQSSSHFHPDEKTSYPSYGTDRHRTSDAGGKQPRKGDTNPAYAASDHELNFTEHDLKDFKEFQEFLRLRKTYREKGSLTDLPSPAYQPESIAARPSRHLSSRSSGKGNDDDDDDSGPDLGHQRPRRPHGRHDESDIKYRHRPSVGQYQYSSDIDDPEGGILEFSQPKVRHGKEENEEEPNGVYKRRRVTARHQMDDHKQDPDGSHSRRQSAARHGRDEDINNAFTSTSSNVQEHSRTPILEHRNPINPFRREGKLLDLPMFLGNDLKSMVKINVIPDTGATLNVISRQYLEETHPQALARLSGHSNSGSGSLNLADGSTMLTLGQLTIPCYFPDAPEKIMQVVFYVCSTLADSIRVLVGKRFLETTKTLTVFAHRRMVERRPVGLRTIPRVMSLATPSSTPRSQFRILIDSKAYLACPDTGSEIDLFNASFATEMNVAIRALITDDPVEIQYANGRRVRILGKAVVDISIAKDASKLHSEGPCSAISITDDEDPDFDRFNRQRASRHNARLTRTANSPVALSRQRTFYLVQGLASNIILGQAFLYSIDAYNTYKSAFVESTASDYQDTLNGIFVTKAATVAPQPPTTKAGLNAALNKVTQRYITEKRKVDKNIESAKDSSSKKQLQADKEALKRDHDRDHGRIQKQYDDAMVQKQLRRR